MSGSHGYYFAKLASVAEGRVTKAHGSHLLSIPSFQVLVKSHCVSDSLNFVVFGSFFTLRLYVR